MSDIYGYVLSLGSGLEAPSTLGGWNIASTVLRRAAFSDGKHDDEVNDH